MNAEIRHDFRTRSETCCSRVLARADVSLQYPASAVRVVSSSAVRPRPSAAMPSLDKPAELFRRRGLPGYLPARSSAASTRQTQHGHARHAHNDGVSRQRVRAVARPVHHTNRRAGRVAGTRARERGIQPDTHAEKPR